MASGLLGPCAHSDPPSGEQAGKASQRGRTGSNRPCHLGCGVRCVLGEPIASQPLHGPHSSPLTC